MQKQIKITIFYDKNLKRITGIPFEEVKVPEIREIIFNEGLEFFHKSLDGFCPVERISEFQKDNPYFKE